METTVSVAGRAEHRRAFVLALAGVAAVGVIGGTVLAFPAGSRVGFSELYLTDLAIGASFTTIGVLITQRQPNNRMGWLFLGIGVVEALVAGLNHYAIVGLSEPSFQPGARWAAWFAYWLVSLVVPSGLFLLLLLLFPSGRPISPAWGWVGRAGLAFSALFALTEILLIPRMEVTSGVEIDNPTNIASSTTPEGAWIVGLAILLIGVAGVVVRYRRASAEERQQLQWFMLAVAAGVGTLALVVLVYWLAGAPEPEPTWFLVTASVVPLVGIGVGVPAACGVAILRYRLWDLKLVVNRTLVYAILTALLVGIYVGAAVGLGVLVRPLTSQENNALVIAASTLAVAALFGPARRRIQGSNDRRFYRRKYDAARTLEAFSARLREEVDLDSLTSELVGVVRSTMQPVHVSLWLRASEPSGPDEGVR